MVDALVDTGACACLLSESVYNMLNNVELLPSRDHGLEGIVAGSKLDIIGSVIIPIGINSYQSEPQELIVARGIGQSMILGINFLDRFGISVNTTERCMVIPDEGEDLAIPVKAFSALKGHRVVAGKQMNVPERSVAFLDVIVEGLMGDVDGFIEGVEADNPNYLVPRSLHSIRDSATRIECLNFTEQQVVVQKGQLLGHFYFMPPASACGVGVRARDVAAAPVDVRELFDLSGSDLTTRQQEIVYGLLEENSKIIGTSEYDLGLTRTVEHKIELEQPDPIKQPYRRFPAPLQKQIRGEIERLLDLGVIEPSTSAWSSPLVPVRKRDGTLRMCIDYRALNARTKKDSFPLPNLADSVSRFRKCQYFSSLDLLSGYHQIAMEKGSRELTAFSDGTNLYQYLRMPFGVCNGPASFSRLVAVVLSGVPFDVANAYLDDILVAGRDFDEHAANLQLVFGRLAQHGLKLNAGKCSLFRKEVEYLGHMVGREGIKPLGKNIKAIVEYPRPQTVKQLRSFNGMCNYYKKFIPHSEDLMRPLYRATSGKRLTWSNECDEAFAKAKDALITAPVLAYPDFNENAKFIVTCDASAFGAGATLSQIQDGEERVLGYAGTSFNEAQCKYSPTDRELAAIRFAVVHFKPLLYGRTFLIRTDHEPLIYLYNMRRFDDRLHRTIEDLNIGHYELEYLPGKYNVAADTLSRARYPWTLPDDDNRVCWEPAEALSKFEVVEVKGGGNSLFAALELLVGESADVLRDQVATLIRKRPERYGYTNNSKGQREIELLRDPAYFPPLSTLQAIGDYICKDIVVYFEGGPTFTYRSPNSEAAELNLLCCGGVHFNVLKPKGFETAGANAIQTLQVKPVSDVELTLASARSEFRAAQIVDSDLSELKQIVSINSEEVLGRNLRGFQAKRSKLSIDQNDLLVFEKFPNQFVPVVPGSSLVSLATELHVILSHAGRDKTISVMYHRLYHPDFPKVIADVVRACQACQSHKGGSSSKHPVYRRHAEKPYQLYAVDLMDLPKSKRGFTTVLTGIDICSKFAHVVPLRSKQAKAVARALEQHVLATVPQIPKAILSDNGPEFRSATFNNLLNSYGIEHEYSVPYAPNTNGAIERFNRTLKSRLATVCHDNTRHWDRELSQVVAQYNRTPHTETGKAPVDFFVTGSDIIVPKKSNTWRQAPKFKSFAVGDLVLRRTPYQGTGERDKLAPKYQGPLRIVKVDPGGVTYRAKWVGVQKKPVTVHQSQIKRFYGAPPAVRGRVWERSPRGQPKSSRQAEEPSDFGLNVDLLNQIPYVPEPVLGVSGGSCEIEQGGCQI